MGAAERGRQAARGELSPGTSGLSLSQPERGLGSAAAWLVTLRTVGQMVWSRPSPRAIPVADRGSCCISEPPPEDTVCGLGGSAQGSGRPAVLETWPAGRTPLGGSGWQDRLDGPVGPEAQGWPR